MRISEVLSDQYVFHDMVRGLPRSHDLSRVFSLLLDMIDDNEVVTVVDRAVIAAADDPLSAAALVRAAIAQALDRRARKAQALPGANGPKLGDVIAIIKCDASIAQAARIIYQHLLDPPVPRAAKPGLLKAMYSVEDEDDRDRLERDALAAKTELDRAKAEEARAEAGDELDDEHADDEDLGRLLHLAGASLRS